MTHCCHCLQMLQGLCEADHRTPSLQVEVFLLPLSADAAGAA